MNIPTLSQLYNLILDPNHSFDTFIQINIHPFKMLHFWFSLASFPVIVPNKGLSLSKKFKEENDLVKIIFLLPER